MWDVDKCLISVLLPFALSACAPLSSMEMSREKLPAIESHTSDGYIRLSKSQYSRIGITTVRPQIQSVPLNRTFDGEVRENEYKTTPILSMVSGRVADLNVEVGNEIKKGDVLAILRSAEVASIEAELLEKVLAISADIEQSKVRFDLARKQYERNRLLFGEGIKAQAMMETAEGEFEEARITLKNLQDKKQSIILTAKERFRLFGIKPQEIDAVLETGKINDQFEIVAPSDGTLIERNIDMGQLVDKSFKLFEISDLSTVWMAARAFEKDIRHIKRGQSATIILDSYPERRFEGTVKSIANVMDPKTRTLSLIAIIDNSENILRPNMFGKMLVKVSTQKRFVLPTQAIQKIGEADIVFVEKEEGVFEERAVRVGAKFESLQEVISGVGVTEKIVVKGSLELVGLAQKNAS